MKVSAIAECLGLDLESPRASIKKFSIDSRDATHESCFFAIVGDRVDGHNFIPNALETGARIVS
ncbi:MAG: hypothetical protein HRU09_14330 [Oligoflexales bacterium]|nr:hypothetical protein [Oligoflexales bacterium]